MEDSILPLAIAVTAYFRVDDIEARAAGEILQVLWSPVSPSPGAPIPVPKSERESPQMRQPVPEMLRQG